MCSLLKTFNRIRLSFASSFCVGEIHIKLELLPQLLCFHPNTRSSTEVSHLTYLRTPGSDVKRALEQHLPNWSSRGPWTVKDALYQRVFWGSSLVGLRTFTVVAPASVLGRGTKILQKAGCSQKKKSILSWIRLKYIVCSSHARSSLIYISIRERYWEFLLLSMILNTFDNKIFFYFFK